MVPQCCRVEQTIYTHMLSIRKNAQNRNGVVARLLPSISPLQNCRINIGDFEILQSYIRQFIWRGTICPPHPFSSHYWALRLTFLRFLSRPYKQKLKNQRNDTHDLGTCDAPKRMCQTCVSGIQPQRETYGKVISCVSYNPVEASWLLQRHDHHATSDSLPPINYAWLRETQRRDKGILYIATTPIKSALNWRQWKLNLKPAASLRGKKVINKFLVWNLWIFKFCCTWWNNIMYRMLKYVHYELRCYASLRRTYVKHST